MWRENSFKFNFNRLSCKHSFGQAAFTNIKKRKQKAFSAAESLLGVAFARFNVSLCI